MMTQKVSKSSIKVSHFKLRRLVFALVFLFAAQGVWAQTEYTWTGTENAVITNLNNWKTATEDPATSLPGNTDSVIIPSGCSYYPSITSAMVNNIASIKVDGQLTITDDFTLAKIDTDSSGTLIVTEKLTNSSDNNAPSLDIQCNTLEVSENLQCKSMSVTSTTSLTNTSGNTYLSATGENGISFGGTVTSNSSGIQFLLIGNITATSAVNINVERGQLNHIEENTNHHKDWSENITVNLQYGGTSFGLQGQSYKIKVSANSGNVYLVGSGTISSLDDSGSNSACTLNFGDTAVLENTFTLTDITLSKITDVVLNTSCKGLKGTATLSGVKNLSIASTQLSGSEDKIVPTISLAAGATISGNNVNFGTVTCAGAVTIQPDTGKSFSFDSLTCNGNTTISGNNTFTDFTASGLGGSVLTIDGTQTITNAAISGNNTNKLSVKGSGSLKLSNPLIANYLDFPEATGPSVTLKPAYASNSTATGGNIPTGWIVVDAEQHVWNGTNSTWEAPDNWLPQSVPQSTDDVIINAGAPYPQISTDVTVNSITLNGAATLTVASTKSLTISTGCELNENITGEGTLVLATGQTYTVSSAKEFDISIENNGTLNAGANAVSFKRNFIDNGTLTASSIIFNGSVDQSFTARAGTNYSAITISKTSGTFTAENAFTAGSFTVDSAKPCNINFKAGNTITTFTATNQGGKTFNFGGTTQNISSFTASGSSDSSLLTLTGTGWTLDATTYSLENTAVKNATAANTISVADCKDLGGNSNWNFLGETYEWTGASNTIWTNSSNWSPASVPGLGVSVVIRNDAASFPVITNNISLTYNDTYKGSVTNNGTITFSGVGVTTGFTAGTLSNGTQNSTIIYAGASTPVWGYDYKNLTVSSGAITFANPVTVSGTATNNGTININDSMSAGTVSGTGTINLNGSGGATTLTAANTSTQDSIVLNNTTATITGNFTLTSFTATAATNMAGKSITLNNSTIAATSISLSGASGSLLSLIGAGTTHKFDTSSLTASYLSIDSNILLEHYTTLIPDCVPAAGETPQDKWLTVMHNGWNIKTLSYFTYTWTGTAVEPADKTDWHTPLNWDTGYVPDTDCKIIIPSTTNKPVISSACAGGTLTIESGASVQLGANNLTLCGTENGVTGTAISNSGTIIYTAAGRITNGTNAINDADTTRAGKVQYAAGGTGTITDATNSFEYYDLEVLGTGWNFSGNYKIKNKLTTGTGETGVTEKCTVSGISTIQAATFDFKGPVNFTADLTLAPYDATTEFTIPSNLHEKVNTTNKKWLYLGINPTILGTTPENIKFSSDADFSYKLYLYSTATVNAEILLRNSITATQNIDGTGSLVFTGTGDQIFTTNNKEFVNIQETKGSGNLTIDGTPTITNFTTGTDSKGNIIFSNGASLPNGFIQYDGTTTVKGTISTTNSNLSVKELILSDAATIDTGTGIQTYGTIEGTTAATQNLTLNASTVTLNGNVGATTSLNTLTVNAAIEIGTTPESVQLTASQISFNSDITDGAVAGSRKKLSIDSPSFESTKGTAANITVGELALLQNSEFQSTTEIVLNTAKISGATAATKLTNSGTLTLADDIEVETAIENGGSLTCSNATFANDVDLTNGTFTHNTGGTIYLTAAKKSPAIFSGSRTFVNLTITGNVNITGSNTIATLTASNLGGKTITFTSGTTQTVTTMTLTGTSDSSKLTLAASSTENWNISCANEPTLQYLSVTKSTNSSSPAKNFVALNSTDGGGNVDWNFPDMPYEWQGSTTSSDWNNTSNWKNGVIPTKGATVTIPKLTDDNLKYPSLENLLLDLDLNTSYDGNDKKGTIIVKPGATFDLAGRKVTAGEIVNNGHIKLNGVQDQIVATTTEGTETGAKPVVEYTGSGATTYFVWDSDNDDSNGKQYVNLILNRAGAEVSDNLEVSGKLEINAAASIANAKSISATGENVTSTAGVTGDGKLIFVGNQAQTFAAGGNSYSNIEKTGTYNLTVNTDLSVGNFTITGGAQTTFEGTPDITTLNADSSTGIITFNNGASITDLFSHEYGETQITGNLYASNFTLGTTTITGNTNIFSSGNQEYNGQVYGGGTLTLDSTYNSGSGTIFFNADVDKPSNVTTPLASLETTGSVTINAAKVKTSATQVYNGLVDLGSCDSLTLEGTNITFKSNVTDSVSATSLELNGPVTINNTLSLTAQTITFKDDVTGSTAGTELTINAHTIIGKAGLKLTVADEIDFAGDIGFANDISADDKKLILNTPIFKSTKSGTASDITAKTLELARDVKFESTKGINLDLTNVTGTGYTLTNNATLEFTSAEITVGPIFNNDTSGKLTASSGKTTFTANVDLSTDTDKFDHNNGIVVLDPADDSMAVNGSSIFYTLQATNLGRKTITFGNGTKQSATNLTLTGTSDANKLTLTSTGNWEIESVNEPVLKYLIVKNSTNTSTNTNFVAHNSTDGGSNVNWSFPDMTYTWTGAAVSPADNTDWNTPANWNVNAKPTKGSTVIIAVADSDKYPKLSVDLDLNTTYGGNPKNGIITVNAGATFDLANRDLTAGTITNNGTVRLTGGENPTTSANQTINAAMVNGSGSTVEYYGTNATPANLAWDGDNGAGTYGKQYEILIINQTATINDNLDVNNTLTAKEELTLGCSTVTSKNEQTYEKAVTLTNNVIFKADDNKLILFEDEVKGAAGTETLTTSTGNSQFEGAVSKVSALRTAATATFNSGVSFTNVGTLTTAKVNINCAALATTGNQTYQDDVTLGIETELSAASDSALIYFKKKLTGNGSDNLTITTAKSKFDGVVSSINKLTTAATATFNNTVTVKELETQKADINTSSIETTTGGQTYNDEVTLLSNTKLTVPENQTIEFKKAINGNFTLETTQTAIFGDAVKVGTLQTQKAQINTTAIETTTGGQTYNDEVTLGSDTTLTVPENQTIDFEKAINGNYTLITTQTAIFNDTVTIGTLQTQKANINTSSIETTTGGQTFNNAVTIQKTTTLTSSSDINFATASSTLNTSGNYKITFVAGTNNIIFAGKVGTSNPLYEIQITSAANTVFNDEVKISTFDPMTDAATGNLTFKNGGTITSSLIHTVNNTDITGTLNVTTADTYIELGDTTGGAMTLNGETFLRGNFQPTENASFTKNLYLCAASNSVFGTDSTTKTASITGNLIIKHGAVLTINAPTSATNFVFYKGAVTVKANLTASDDIIILGNNYSTTDTSTDIAGEYAYNCARPTTWSQPNYNNGTFEALDYNATISVKGGITVQAGKNFYANGTTLSKADGSSQWNLNVPDLTNPANGFAEAYFSHIEYCNAEQKLVTLECDDDGNNINVDFDDFEIEEAYTVRDNVVYVKFNRPVRYHNATIGQLKFNNDANDIPTLTFTGLYSDPDCQTSLDFDTQVSELYIKATSQDSGVWNTDATGKDPGTANSTDRAGVHRDTIPCLDFPRALNDLSFILTDRWGKRLNNYSRRVTKGNSAEPAYGSTDSTHDVLDHTGPVLYSVRTGQELHNSNIADQKAYDSHNFIEFRYSEQVDFVGSNNDTDLNNLAASENIQVTSSLGAVLGDIAQSDNLEIAGLGKIQSGLIYTGRNGSKDPYVNSLYRLDDYSIRLSIAGYVDGTVSDSASNVYKNWVGYIERAEQLSGTVNLLVDTAGKIGTNEGRVKDRAVDSVLNPASNWQVQYQYADANYIPTVNSTPDGLYGDWDISEPIFAIIRQNNRKLWEQTTFDANYQAEAIGNNPSGSSTLDRIEFHLYDNTPAFANDATEPEWFTEVGWGAHGSNGDKDALYKDYTYAADIFGGSRPFVDDAAIRTTGGIRYSSVTASAKAFKYGVGSSLPESQLTASFDEVNPVYSGATSLIFTGASNPRRSAADLEGLYFALPLANHSLDVKTSFTVRYDETKGFITDLAGNRLRSKTISTIDRTPPSIDMTICPVGADEVEIVFVKELCTDSKDINYIKDPITLDNITIDEEFEDLITQCLDIITIDSSGAPHAAEDLAFDTATPAKVWVTTNSINSSFTHIKLKLSRTVTLEDIEQKFIRVTYVPKYGETSVDLFTQKDGSRVTFIQDENGNTIQMYTAHALSDFAVGAINPLYAYDSAIIWDDGTVISEGLWHKDTTDDVDTESWAVHDWNRDQKNYGTLPAGHTVAVVADSTDGTAQNAAPAVDVKIYVSQAPDEQSVSTQANKDFEFEVPWRIWLPNVTAGVFTALSETNNTQYSEATGTLLNGKDSRLIFDLNSDITDLWKSGDQITFLFGIVNNDGSPVTIMHSPELDINNDTHYLPGSTKMPLYALRQTDPDDFLSLDLWSFRLKDIVNQRGGVTVLNNVINSNDGEKVVVKVNQPQKGNVNVLVMTLDGNIVDYLHRGESEAGEHYYSWDGSNRNGNPVARGMYFIRVTGPGLDETRKVLVVK